MLRPDRWVVVALVGVATIAIIAILADSIGASATSLSFIPAAVAGGLLGRRRGLLVGLATGVVTELALITLFHRPAAVQDLLYVGIHVGMGGTFGWLHDARAKAQAASSRTRLLFDRNPVPVWVFDDETLRFLDVNEAALSHYGYTREAWLKMRVTDLRPPEDVPGFLTERAARDRTRQRTVEARHRKADGSTIDVVVTAANMELDGRNVVLAIAQDVTQKKRAEEALRRTERLTALGTLVAGVAHEINNPLAYMRGNVELAMMEIDDVLARADVPPAVREELEDLREGQDAVLRGTEQIARITSGLRQVARRDEGVAEDVDVDALVREALEVASPNMPAGVEIKTALASPGRVRIVRGDLSQVLLNLVLNAAEAVGQTPAPRIAVRTRSADGRIAIEVEDNGVGIAPADREKLFVPFYTTKPEGTGLGLSISQRIVADHGGSIEVESAPGVGSTFRVLLPSAVARAPRATAPLTR